MTKHNCAETKLTKKNKNPKQTNKKQKKKKNQNIYHTNYVVHLVGFVAHFRVF